MSRRMGRRHERRRRRRRSVRERLVQFVKALFSSTPLDGDWLEDTDGGVGVREPRRPLRPILSGAVTLESPPDESRDVWAVGDERG